MDFVIDRFLLGTTQHLLVAGERTWVEVVPPDVWHLSGGVKNGSSWCLDSALRLENALPDLDPPPQFVNAMRTVCSSSKVWPPPWKSVMTPRAFQSFSDALVTAVRGAMEGANTRYYRDTWVAQNEVFASFARAKVSEAGFREAVAALGNTKVTRSFMPDSSGYAEPVVYDRFGTRTGRLTTASGPMMLILRKDLRAKLIEPLERGHRLYMLDYSALEPRLLLYETGFRCEEADMYEAIRRDHLPDIDREAVKAAVIYSRYGMSKHAWGERAGVSGKQLDRIDSALHGLFGANNLLKRLKKQFVADGYIRNRFNRRVLVEEPADHLIINSYAQSSGADVALLGFKKMLPLLRKKEAKPLFLLHDAVMVSAPDGSLDGEPLRVKTPGYVQKFVVKATPA